MKKLLLTTTLLGSFFAADAQLWMPFDSNLDTITGIRYMDALDSNTVWAIGFDGTFPARTYNKFTRTIDGVNYLAGSFYADTNTFSPANISAVDANTAYVSSYAKAGDGTPGQILKTTDGGLNWNNVATANMYNGAANFPNVVHFWDANFGWTMGDPNNTFSSGNEFEIWRTADAGLNWARVAGANIPNPLSGEYGTVDVYTTFGSKYIWYGTNKGRIFRSSDTGSTYLATQLTTMAGGIYGISFRDSIHGMAWGGATTATTPAITIKVTSDGGVTWTTLVTTATGVSIGWNGIDNVPGTNRYLSVGLNVPRSAYVTSITNDDGLTWTELENGLTNAERMIELEVTDSTHAWGANFSDNTLPLGLGGINKFNGPNMATIGLRPIAEVSAFNVYPNPTNGVVTLKLEKVFAGSVIKVTDILGNEVYSNTFNSAGINKEISLDLSSFAKGIYMVNIVNGKNVDARKIIVE